MIMEKKRIGDFGEEAACRYLIKQNYIIRERNFRMKCGEIDIIASKNGVLVFVEVKTRLFESCGSGAESVTAAKRQRIRRCALCYMAICQKHFDAVDFQVIEISADHLEGLEF